jgi:hypothetical protein
MLIKELKNVLNNFVVVCYVQYLNTGVGRVCTVITVPTMYSNHRQLVRYENERPEVYF